MLSLIPWKKNAHVDETRMLPFSSFRRELDPLFGRLLENFWGEGDGVQWDPVRLEVEETDESFVIRAEIPGVDPKDIDVQLAGDVLVLSGEKRTEQRNAGEAYTYSERRYGSFRRAVRLSMPVDPESVKAEHRNGVVTVTLEKSAAVRPKRIAIKSN
jgi:HSP20 family protein